MTPNLSASPPLSPSASPPLSPSASQFKAVLTDNILPYWLRLQDPDQGGFYGCVLADETVVKEANRGAILYGRILWTFSAAYRVLGNPEYLKAAKNAKDYILNHFIDKQYGGVYWELDYLGNPVNDRKQFYALGFIIYGLTEYVRATGDVKVLPYAVDLYHCLEQYAWDPKYGGYIEATQRDWSKIEDYRLSEKDLNAPKSQNTHLHILEPYTNLYRVWPTEELKHSILRLIDVFKNHIVQPSGHLGLFFDNDWNVLQRSGLSAQRSFSDSGLSGEAGPVSCGHDIEFSWLLDEACEVIGINEDETVQHVAQAAKEGLQPNGLMEGTWWEQCETIIGYTNIYHRFGDQQALSIAERCWEATKQYFIDYEHGEWWEYPHLSASQPLSPSACKAGFWKCPYHNSRLCLQLITHNS